MVVSSIGLTACGDETPVDATSSGSSTTPTSVGSVTEPGTESAPGVPPKPQVKIPAALPTKLVITDLVDGTGSEAKNGDTVVVHYVGVRSADGTEFDNSYDRGQPFNVTLGAGGVIPGWDQGLIGVRQGMQRQLDIPSDLAYGDNPQGDIIQAGDELTFVVDVVAVLPVADPADAPAITVEAAANVTELAFEDLIEGDGAELQPGQTAALHIIAYRADTGEQLNSSWETGQLEQIPFVEGSTLPGLITGMAGMKTGGRRQLTIPFVDAFGEAGNAEFGLPPSTDMVLVLDLIAAF